MIYINIIKMDNIDITDSAFSLENVSLGLGDNINNENSYYFYLGLVILFFIGFIIYRYYQNKYKQNNLN